MTSVSFFCSYLKSPVRLIFLLLHVTLSVSSPALIPILFISYLHASILFVSNLPSSQYIKPQCFLHYVFVCTNHLCVVFFKSCTTFIVPRLWSFLILSLRVTPHSHSSILISFTSIRVSCLFVDPMFLPASRVTGGWPDRVP